MIAVDSASRKLTLFQDKRDKIVQKYPYFLLWCYPNGDESIGENEEPLHHCTSAIRNRTQYKLNF